MCMKIHLYIFEVDVVRVFWQWGSWHGDVWRVLGTKDPERKLRLQTRPPFSQTARLPPELIWIWPSHYLSGSKKGRNSGRQREGGRRVAGVQHMAEVSGQLHKWEFGRGRVPVGFKLIWYQMLEVARPALDQGLSFSKGCDARTHLPLFVLICFCHARARTHTHTQTRDEEPIFTFSI